jgi:hypothetical protein
MGNLFCPKTCPRFWFLSFNPILSSCPNNGPEKNLSRETCLDLELRNKKNLSVSLFFIDRLPRPVSNLVVCLTMSLLAEPFCKF